MRIVAVILAALFALAAGHSAAGQDDVVGRIAEAYGTPAARERLKAYRIDAELEATVQGMSGSVRRDYQFPERLRVEIAYPTTREVRILDGENGWRGDDRVLRKVDGLPRLAMLYQAVRSGVPEVLMRRRSELQELGRRTREATEYLVLGLSWSPELEVTFWVHPKSHRVIWVEGTLRSGQDRAAFATRYGNFQEVEGVVVPFLEENFVGPQRTGVTKVRSVTFAPEDLGPFSPAGAKQQRMQ